MSSARWAALQQQQQQRLQQTEGNRGEIAVLARPCGEAAVAALAKPE